MASPGNILWATGGSVLINGAFLAILVFTLPQTKPPVAEMAMTVSLVGRTPEAEVVETAEPPAQTPVRPPPSSEPVASAATSKAQTQAETQAQTQVQSPASSAESAPATPQTAPSPATSSGGGQPAARGHPAPASPQPAASRSSAPAANGNPKAATGYAAKVRLHLESFKVYPPQARRRHLRGVVMLAFTIDRQGRVLSGRIAKTSGVGELDQAALDMLAAAQPLPVPPAEVTGERIAMTVPVEFGQTD